MQPDKSDLKSLVVDYPFASVAIGFAAGAGVAYITRPRSLIGRAFVGFAGVAIRALAFDQVRRYATNAAASWLAARDQPATASSEVHLS